MEKVIHEVEEIIPIDIVNKEEIFTAKSKKIVKEITRKTLLYTLMTVFALILFFPLLYALMISFMTSAEVFSGKLIPSSFTLDNYIKVFQRIPLVQYFINSTLSASLITIVQVLIACLSAFAFTFIKFKGQKIIFFFFIATMMVPWEATIIPNFIFIRSLGLYDTILALTLPFFATAFGIFLMRQQFKTIPYELYEASRVVGVSRFRFFWQIILPLSKSSIATLAIYSFVSSWNMYLWPLLVTNSEKSRPITIGITRLQQAETASEWGIVMAAAVMIILPALIVLFVGQRKLESGLMSGAIK